MPCTTKHLIYMKWWWKKIQSARAIFQISRAWENNLFALLEELHYIQRERGGGDCNATLKCLRYSHIIESRLLSFLLLLLFFVFVFLFVKIFHIKKVSKMNCVNCAFLCALRFITLQHHYEDDDSCGVVLLQHH